MRQFDWSSFLRSLLATLAGGAVAALALFADPGFVREALGALPDWAQTLIVVFVAGGLVGGGLRAKDGSTFKR